MRWNSLFADLEAQATTLENAERAAEVDERTRGELARIGLLDRVRASGGTALRLRLAGGRLLVGTVGRVGADWLLVHEETGREAVVPAAGLVGVRGAGRFAERAAGAVESRLGLRHALRGVARDRSAVRIELSDGASIDATIDRVGADFVEVAGHAPAEARRRSEVRDVELVAVAAIVAVRRGA